MFENWTKKQNQELIVKEAAKSIISDLKQRDIRAFDFEKYYIPQSDLIAKSVQMGYDSYDPNVSNEESCAQILDEMYKSGQMLRKKTSIVIPVNAIPVREMGYKLKG